MLVTVYVDGRGVVIIERRDGIFEARDRMNRQMSLGTTAITVYVRPLEPEACRTSERKHSQDDRGEKDGEFCRTRGCKWVGEKVEGLG